MKKQTRTKEQVDRTINALMDDIGYFWRQVENNVDVYWKNILRVNLNSEMGENKPQLDRQDMNELWEHISQRVHEGVDHYLEDVAYNLRDSVSYWKETGEWEEE